MKKNAGKAPSIQWYFKDWNSDERLKLCSYAAKGFWSDIISQSCEMEIQGVFAYKDGEKPDHFIEISDEKFPKKFENFCQISAEKFLKMFGGKTAEKRKLFAELRKYNVLKKSQDGTLYVQRIYRDMQLRIVRAAAGKQGGNPKLADNLLDDLDKQKGKQNPTPSSSTSSSTSINDTTTTTMAGQNFGDDDIQNIIAVWNKVAKKKTGGAEFLAIKLEVSKLLGDPANLITLDTIFQAIKNYGQAVSLPKSQAGQFTLCNFLRRAVRNYLPGYFDIDNYDKSKFEENTNGNKKRSTNNRPSLNEQDWGQELIPTGKNEM